MPCSDDAIIMLTSLDSLYGDREALLAKWFKRTGKRDKIFLATKFDFIKGSKTLRVDSPSEFCKRACDESLRILDVDLIDLCKYLPFRLTPSAKRVKD